MKNRMFKTLEDKDGFSCKISAVVSHCVLSFYVTCGWHNMNIHWLFLLIFLSVGNRHWPWDVGGASVIVDEREMFGM